MIESKVIIVGGGPAGSSCAWKLKQNGIDCIILDKQQFPRTKLCAGWITPEVLDYLNIDEATYPHSLKVFHKFLIHLYNRNFSIKVHQFAIKRYEFDDWLLKRSGATVHTHEVKNIEKDGHYYIIDDQFRCEYLVGAGGTHCPVYRSLFKRVRPRAKDLLVVTLEQEFAYDYRDDNCHLWFMQHQLPGYSWYVPKGKGILNIGIGGLSQKLKAKNDTIKRHWELFTQQLEQLSLVKNYRFNPRGYVYYIRDGVEHVQLDRAYLVGDAVGLATQDMGEGISPAVQSGLLAANAIITGQPYSLKKVKKYSIEKYRMLIKLMNFFLR